MWRVAAARATAATLGVGYLQKKAENCGIVGVVGEADDARDVLLDGLSILQNRGYDSAGIAVDAAPHDGGAKGAGGSVDDRERRKPTPSTRQQLQTGRPEPEGAAAAVCSPQVRPWECSRAGGRMVPRMCATAPHASA